MVKKLLLMTLFAATLFLSILISTSVRGDLTIIRVPSDYSTIQQAINSASIGSVILVSSGTYNECVVVNKTLQIIGAEKTSTILEGDGHEAVVTVAADDVLISGFTIQNSSNSGIQISHHNNLTVDGNIITQNDLNAIFLDYSNTSLISNNIITEAGTWLLGFPSGGGIRLAHSHHNSMRGNVIVDSVSAIILDYSNNNLIQRNVMENNEWGGMLFSWSNSCIVHHNLLIHEHAEEDSCVSNFWDDGSEGNYWGSYFGLDDGSNGRVVGDGVGDTDLPHLGLDNYPLVRPPEPIPAIWKNTPYPVAFVSNSTISSVSAYEPFFVQAERRVAFKVTGSSGTLGYCNITIPKDLLLGNPWTVKLDSTDITAQTTMTQNQTHSFIYFAYNHSTHNVQIVATWVVPEFNEHIILILALILTALASVLRRKPTRVKHSDSSSLKPFLLEQFLGR